jgi:hypothetical protein
MEISREIDGKKREGRLRPNKKNIALYFPLSVHDQLITTHTHSRSDVAFLGVHTNFVFSIYFDCENTVWKYAAISACHQTFA